MATATPPLPLGRRWTQVRGVLRSLLLYYRDAARRRAMDRLHAGFMRPGDLVFDIGAHVGDRIASFRRLGCRVVAVEPQPALVATLRLLYGRSAGVTIEPVAVGDHEGILTLHLNLANPTLATGSTAFIAAAGGAAGWEGQSWSHRVDVPLTTLDRLIARHGRPRFIKIDVEGLEAAVLGGLGAAPPALSFEFTTIQRGVAVAALDRCLVLGLRRFNAALGESQSLVFAEWQDGRAIARWLTELPHTANSGDIYAQEGS
ncbi:MAG: FkbM family methyltransferase [Alphaproteobacteria bacterium]|nr:FkbM family methyltransferase [Alphaproteobacteria bacterium]